MDEQYSKMIFIDKDWEQKWLESDTVVQNYVANMIANQIRRSALEIMDEMERKGQNE
jgi:hypothetical protein